jgi:PAS domain S-box-containing protein
MTTGDALRTETLAEIEQRHSPEGLLLRYARGRQKHFWHRQAIILAGCAVFGIFESGAVAALGFLLMFLGETVDNRTLQKCRAELPEGGDFRRWYRLTTVTGALQGLAVALCLSIAWLMPQEPPEPLAWAGFLAGAAVNAGIVLPFHRAASTARLAVYGLTPVTLIIYEIFFRDALPMESTSTIAGLLVLAYSVYHFIAFVNDGFQRNYQNSWNLAKHRKTLEETNRRLLGKERQARRLALVAQNANDSVILINRDGRIAWANTAFERITGYSAREAIGKFPGEMLNAEGTDPETVQKLVDVRKEGRPFCAEILNKRKDGTEIWVETNQVPVLEPSGEIEIVVAV